MPKKTAGNLVEAAKAGDLARVKELIAQGADVNAKTERGKNILEEVYRDRRKEEIACALIRAGADVRAANVSLWMAVAEERAAIVKTLIEAGADVNAGSPLLRAATHGATEMVRLLIEGGADLNVTKLLQPKALLAAIMGNHPETALVLLHAGADISPQEGRWFPLTEAAARGQIEVVKHLVRKRADINARSRYCEVSLREDRTIDARDVTPLIRASRKGRLEVVKALIEAGADLQIRDADGMTALDWARKQKHSDVAEALRATGKAEREDTTEEQLLKAAEAGDAAKVRSLIQAQVNLAPHDPRRATKSLTPLMLAAAAGHVEVVKALIEAGAEVNGTDESAPASDRTSSFGAKDLSRENLQELGRSLRPTPLSLAAEHGHAEVVRALVRAGSDVNAQDQLGRTPLMLAVNGNHSAIVEGLLTAKADVHARNKDQETALSLAVQRQNAHIARLLMAAGAKVNLKCCEGGTPLMKAAERCNLELVELLLNAGAKATTRSKGSGGPVKAASGATCEKPVPEGTAIVPMPEDKIVPAVKCLLEAGADANAADGMGTTALMDAARNGYGELARMLLNAGANVRAADHTGWTALHWATVMRKPELVSILLNAGADPNASDSEGRTPFSLALKNKKRNKTPITLLEQRGGKKTPRKAQERELVAVVEEKWQREQAVAPPDFRSTAQRKAFRDVVAKLVDVCGTKPSALGDTGGVSFHVHSSKTVELGPLQRECLAKGCYVFTPRVSHGDRVSALAALPTSDKYEAIAYMQTNGCNFGLGPGGIIKWLKKLEKEQPFVLTGIGHDFLDGSFTRPIKHPKALARRMYKFCPDIVDQGCGTVEALTEVLKEKRRLFFWWD
jgi:ankyrin repeat protein